MSHFTTLQSLLSGMTAALDLSDGRTSSHYERTAYLSYRIAEECGLTAKECRRALYRSLMIGAAEYLKECSYTARNLHENAVYLKDIGKTMRQLLPRTWQEPGGPAQDAAELHPTLKSAAKFIPKPFLLDGIIALARKLEPEIRYGEPALKQGEQACRTVIESGRLSRELRVVTERLAKRDLVWMDLALGKELLGTLIGKEISLNLDEAVSLSQLIALIIDFRSPFTRMHSAGVAASAVSLAELLGMSAEEQKKMAIAGNLHDLGKLRVPASIIEKNGKLTEEEFALVKEHPYFTYQILKRIEGFGEIAEWAGWHHEKMNGKGYPFGLPERELPLGTRIMSAADVFSALTEERPYRKALPKEKVLDILRENVEAGSLSRGITELLSANYEKIDSARREASSAAGKRYIQAGMKQSETS